MIFLKLFGGLTPDSSVGKAQLISASAHTKSKHNGSKGDTKTHGHWVEKSRV